MGKKNTAPAPSAVVPETAAPGQAEHERLALLREILLLEAQIKGMEKAVAGRRTRLQALMGSMKAVRVDEGDAVFYPARTFAVTDALGLCRKLVDAAKTQHPDQDPLAAVAGLVKVTAGVMDGAKKAGVDLTPFVRTGEDRRFKIEPAKTAAAKELRARLIESNQEKTEARVAEVAASLGFKPSGFKLSAADVAEAADGGEAAGAAPADLF